LKVEDSLTQTEEMTMADQWKNQFAISKAIKGAALKTARAKLTLGVHQIDTTVDIKGTIEVLEDEDYTPTAEVPIKATLALFLRNCGVTRKAAAAALLRAMSDAIAANEVGDAKAQRIHREINAAQTEVDAMIAMAESTAAKLPKKTRNGKVLSDLAVTIR